MSKPLKLLILLLLWIVSHASSMGQSCIQIQPNYFSCGVPTNEFEYIRANTVNEGLQVQSNWCWAACVQMVLNYHGLLVTQMDVVTKIYGSPYVNQAANEPQILAALSGWAPDVSGRYSSIHAYGGNTSVQEIINRLSGKWPLIVGLANPNGGIGHAYVLTAIYYTKRYDAYGNAVAVPDKVVLRDPWPGGISRQEFSWNEFQSRYMMGIKVWVTRH